MISKLEGSKCYCTNEEDEVRRYHGGRRGHFGTWKYRIFGVKREDLPQSSTSTEPGSATKAVFEHLVHAAPKDVVVDEVTLREYRGCHD